MSEPQPGTMTFSKPVQIPDAGPPLVSVDVHHFDVTRRVFTLNDDGEWEQTSVEGSVAYFSPTTPATSPAPTPRE